jgi:hypothetical protein
MERLAPFAGRLPDRMEDTMTAERPVHIRLPQRATAVAGQDPQPGVVVAVSPVDPRTVSQDPVAKPKTPEIGTVAT